MKKILLAAAFGFASLTTIAQTDTSKSKNNNKGQQRSQEVNKGQQGQEMNKGKQGQAMKDQHSKDWKKSANGSWQGKDSTWYKMDNQGNVSSSTDNKKWSPVKDNRWQDNEGNWLTTKNKKLMMSTDNGKTWKEAPEGKWKGSNGMWFKYGSDGTISSMGGDNADDHSGHGHAPGEHHNKSGGNK